MATAKKAAAKRKKKIKVPVPTVGRIVHYTGNDNETRAAVITRQPDHPRGPVSLMVLGHDGSSRFEEVPFAETPAPGAWSWPKHVPDQEIEV